MDDFENPILAEYRKSLPSKLVSLRQRIEEVKQKKSLNALETLHREVHKLTGNTGTYGYITASNLCKDLDKDLKKKIENFDSAIFSEEWFISLHLFLQKMETAFIKPDTNLFK